MSRAEGPRQSLDRGPRREGPRFRHETIKGGLVEQSGPKRSRPGNCEVSGDHAQGNLRALMNMAGELLAYAAEREARQIDEKLFLETCAPPAADAKAAAGRRR